MSNEKKAAEWCKTSKTQSSNHGRKGSIPRRHGISFSDLVNQKKNTGKKFVSETDKKISISAVNEITPNFPGPSVPPLYSQRLVNSGDSQSVPYLINHSPKYKCGICGVLVLDLSALNVHFGQQHGDWVGKPPVSSVRPKYQCGICGLLFLDVNTLNAHFLGQHREMVPHSEMSPNELHGQSSDKKQTDAQSPVKAFANTVQAETATYTFHLEDIKSLCNAKIAIERLPSRSVDNQKYKCGVCGKVYLRLSNLKPHLEKHKKEYSTECEQCHKLFKNKDTLRAHIKYVHNKVKTWKCSFCSMSFGRRSELVVHERESHTGTFPFSCSQCDKSFSIKAKLNQHMKVHFTPTDYYQQRSEVRCQLCGIVCHSEGYLKRHHLRKHVLPKPVIKCDKCEKQFKSQHCLTWHVRIVHDKVKPWTCNVCNKSFGRKTELLFHERRHTGEYPYRCPYCKKSFVAKFKLNQHIKVHIGTDFIEKSTNCEECDQEFTYRLNLKDNVSVECLEVVKCPKCDETANKNEQ